ncbi:unnamed protein product, partial [Rotaria sp. Silwood1]
MNSDLQDFDLATLDGVIFRIWEC